MDFNANIQILITSATTGRTAELQTIHSFSMEDDSKQIGSSAKIVVPLAARIQYQDGAHDFLTDIVKNLFNSGDKVVVTAWYDDYPVLTIFTGFIYEFIEGTPMTIECLDNIYLLNQTTVNLAYASISLTALLEQVLTGTGITLILPTLDLQLVNISFRLMSPAAILQWFRTELGLNVSLIGTQLYMNIASNVISVGYLDTRRNVLKCALQKPSAVYLKLKVKAWFIQENGKKTSMEVGDPHGELREVFFYRIPFNAAVYQKLAGEALIKYKQMKFSGHVHTYLYPMLGLFWKVQFMSYRFPDQNGNYTVMARKFVANETDGFHWDYDLAYLSDIDSAVDQLAADNQTVNLNPQ